MPHQAASEMCRKETIVSFLAFAFGENRLWELQGSLGGRGVAQRGLRARGVSERPAQGHLCLLPPFPAFRTALASWTPLAASMATRGQIGARGNHDTQVKSTV